MSINFLINSINVFNKKYFLYFSILFFLLVLIKPFNAFAVTSYGEGVAKISNGNIDNAKVQALNYAKLEAIENVSNINIKNETLIKDSKLLDETIKQEFSGKIIKYTVLEEKNENGFIKIKIKADIDFNFTDSAKKSDKNKKISAFLTVLSIDEKNKYYENEILVNAIAKDFQKKEIIVNNYAISKAIKKNIIDSIMSNKYINLDNIFNNSKYDYIIIGISKYEVRNTDVGYGDTTFTIANGDFTWKLFSKENGKFKLTNTDKLLKRGVGATNSVAIEEYNKSIIESSYKIVSDVSETILKNKQKTIKLTLGNEFSLEDILELKKDLQNIPFLINIDLEESEYFLVEYAEKPYYLAIFLEETKKYVIKEIKNNELVIIKI